MKIKKNAARSGHALILPTVSSVSHDIAVQQAACDPVAALIRRIEYYPWSTNIGPKLREKTKKGMAPFQRASSGV